MGNMSYCRFENTLQDLQDCFEHIHDPVEKPTEKCHACNGYGIVVPKGVKIPNVYTCPYCGGEPGDMDCEFCDNTGTISRGNSNWDEETARESVEECCVVCDGDGVIDPNPDDTVSKSEAQARDELIELCRQIIEEVDE